MKSFKSIIKFLKGYTIYSEPLEKSFDFKEYQDSIYVFPLDTSIKNYSVVKRNNLNKEIEGGFLLEHKSESGRVDRFEFKSLKHIAEEIAAYYRSKE